jgi:hypothetical protein
MPSSPAPNAETCQKTQYPRVLRFIVSYRMALRKQKTPNRNSQAFASIGRYVFHADKV